MYGVTTPKRKGRRWGCVVSPNGSFLSVADRVGAGLTYSSCPGRVLRLPELRGQPRRHDRPVKAAYGRGRSEVAGYTITALLYNGTRTMYEREGFTYDRPKGQGNCVMVREVAPG